MGSWAPVAGTSIGVVGAALTLWMAVPQAWAIWRDRTALGVSYATWFLFCLSFSLWIGYSIRVGNEITLGSNVLSVSTASALMIGLTRVGAGEHTLGSCPLTALATGCVGLAMIGMFGPLGLVAVLLVSAVLVRAPQLARSVRTYRAVAPSEVSRTSGWSCCRRQSLPSSTPLSAFGGGGRCPGSSLSMRRIRFPLPTNQTHG